MLRSFIETDILKTKCFNNIEDPFIKSSMETKLIIIQLDHMRDVRKYTDWIVKTCKILGLHGFVWIKRNPYICLCGEQTEKFVNRLKTETVDVDSRGKACKEKMSKIIYHDVYENFKSHELKVEIVADKPTSSLYTHALNFCNFN